LSPLPNRPGPNALSESVVIEIRELRAQGNSLKLLAEKFDCDLTRISRIARGQVYPEFGGPLTKAEERTHCKHGHKWTAYNTYKHPRTRKRTCLDCKKAVYDRLKGYPSIL
jgi:hypothetical protein